MKVLIAKNKIPNNLLAIVKKAMSDPKKAPTPEEMMADVEMDPEKLGAIMDFIDLIVVECLISPIVKHDPPNEDRDMSPDRVFLYVDEVDLDDKIFIWQYAVGGTRDLEAFRERQERNMEFVSTLENVEHSTK